MASPQPGGMLARLCCAPGERLKLSTPRWRRRGQVDFRLGRGFRDRGRVTKLRRGRFGCPLVSPAPPLALGGAHRAIADRRPPHEFTNLFRDAGRGAGRRSLPRAASLGSVGELQEIVSKSPHALDLVAVGAERSAKPRRLVALTRHREKDEFITQAVATVAVGNRQGVPRNAKGRPVGAAL